MKRDTSTRRSRRSILASVLLIVASSVTTVATDTPAWAAAKFSQPITNVNWQAGTEHLVAWIDGAPGRQPLKLMRGSATALEQVLEIARVDGAAGHYVWAVPADLPPGNDYAIALGNAPDIGYSGQFTISSAGGTAPTLNASRSVD